MAVCGIGPADVSPHVRFILRCAAIEAFFELGNGDNAAVSYVREAHASFLAMYGLSKEEVPLLRLDPGRWDAPLGAA